MTSPQDPTVINRCVICRNPKDDKRFGPCCICVANGKAPSNVVYQRPRQAGKSPMGGDMAQEEFVARHGVMGFVVARPAFGKALPPMLHPHEDIVIDGVHQVFELDTSHLPDGGRGRTYEIPTHTRGDCEAHGCHMVEPSPDGKRYFKHYLKLSEEVTVSQFGGDEPVARYADMDEVPTVGRVEFERPLPNFYDLYQEGVAAHEAFRQEHQGMWNDLPQGVSVPDLFEQPIPYPEPKSMRPVRRRGHMSAECPNRGCIEPHWDTVPGVLRPTAFAPNPEVVKDVLKPSYTGEYDEPTDRAGDA